MSTTTAPPQAAPAAPAPRIETPFQRFVAEFAASRLALAGLAVFTTIVLIAVFAPWIAPQNPYDLAQLDIMDSRLEPGSVGGAGFTHWLGTDDQGRDMLSAIMYGLRISLLVGAGSAGAVMANRLSEEASVSVCVLEAGGHDRHLRDVSGGQPQPRQRR